MARLEERKETYFTTVRGMCRTCRDIVPARVFLERMASISRAFVRNALMNRHSSLPIAIGILPMYSKACRTTHH
jgi:hypothetical protein